MKAVILAGGLGTRLREETEYKPKPMVEIGGRPVLWHLMKGLSQHGINDFIICLGYKGEIVRDYFANFNSRMHDLKIELGEKPKITILDSDFIPEESWSVTLAETGPLTPTGGRIKAIEKYVQNEQFLCTYGDGLSDVNISELIEFHNKHGKMATVTAVQPKSRFGTLNISSESEVIEFKEKGSNQEWVNGGFFIFKPEIFRYLNSDSVLERSPLELISREQQLMAFKHHGFWQPMDTLRENLELNSLWDSGNAGWKTW